MELEETEESFRKELLHDDLSDMYAKDEAESAVWLVLHCWPDQPDGGVVPNGYSLQGPRRQFLYFQGKLGVPTDVAPRLVNEWHKESFYHCGTSKLVDVLQSRFVITNLEKIGREVVRGCQICQATNPPN